MPNNNIRRVFITSTALLTFISFWRAAAVVLCDLASTAYYIGGIVEKVIGKAAPWYILAVMVFSYAVRALYIESCSMFVRGGVYRVVKQAMGSTMAKISVSALMFDYALTGPISGVSAGQYLVGLLNTLLIHLQIPFKLPPDILSVVIAILITLYFWRQNIRGVTVSSDKAMKIMIATTVMAIIVIPWAIYTAVHQGLWHLPPVAPVFQPDSLGFLSGLSRRIAPLGALGLLIAFGHSVLAMSGEESLAQVYRDIEAPKLKNLERAGFIIFLYSLLLTSLVSFLAVMIIPDNVRMTKFADDLISGLALHLAGPFPMRVACQALVVLVGFAILSGAVNTSIVGSNGVLDRVDEDGVLPAILRRPHPEFGTSYRMINLVVAIQIFIIILSRGNVIVLGEAYAFGVVWSFAFKALGMVILRFKDHRYRGFKVPGNIQVGPIEIPVGLMTIFAVLFATACINLLTKKIATISGALFTLVLFTFFTISERLNQRNEKRCQGRFPKSLDEVNRQEVTELTPASLQLQYPTRVVVQISNAKDLGQLQKELQTPPMNEKDVIVVAANIPGAEPVPQGRSREPTMADRLLSDLITVAEKTGCRVVPLLVECRDPHAAVEEIAHDLHATKIVCAH